MNNRYHKNLHRIVTSDTLMSAPSSVSPVT